MRLRMRMGSWRVMIGGARSLLRFGGAMNLRIWSQVRFGGLFLKQQPPFPLLSSLLACSRVCMRVF